MLILLLRLFWCSCRSLRLLLLWLPLRPGCLLLLLLLLLSVLLLLQTVSPRPGAVLGLDHPGLLDHGLLLGDVPDQLGIGLPHNVAQLGQNLLLAILERVKAPAGDLRTEVMLHVALDLGLGRGLHCLHHWPVSLE